MAGAGAFDLFGLSEVRFETLLLVAIRVTMMLTFVPIFSATQVPIMVRIGLGILLAFAISHTVPTLTVPLDLGGITIAVLAQAFTGAVFGFVAFLVFTGIQFAGEIIDIQVGFAVVNVINPISQQQVTVLGELLLALATLLYLVTDSHYFLLSGIAGSFSLLPLPFVGINEIVAHDVITFFTQALFIIFKIAAPVAISLFVVNVSLGLMARVAPQMNVFVVGLPLQIGIGLTMLVVTLPLLGAVLPQLFAAQPQQFDAVLRGLMIASPAPAGP
jgi:flagellar biosynthetic protein FliR